MNPDGTVEAVNECSLDYHIKYQSRRQGTVFDFDVLWGKGKHAVKLRLVGYAHKHDDIRWYLSTVSREQLSAKDIIKAYRLRWSIELLFRVLSATWRRFLCRKPVLLG